MCVYFRFKSMNTAPQIFIYNNFSHRAYMHIDTEAEVKSVAMGYGFTQIPTTARTFHNSTLFPPLESDNKLRVKSRWQCANSMFLCRGLRYHQLKAFLMHSALAL